MTLRPAATEEASAVLALLEAVDLPGFGLFDREDTVVVVAEERAGIVGSAAVERYGNHGLLRSVAVVPGDRSRGLGRALVAEATGAARATGIVDCWLITEDASGYFASLGWQPATRDDLPDAMRLSAEYTAHCTESAAVMVRSLV